MADFVGEGFVAVGAGGAVDGEAEGAVGEPGGGVEKPSDAAAVADADPKADEVGAELVAEGANVVGAACIIELSFLKGRSRLDVPFTALAAYDE